MSDRIRTNDIHTAYTLSGRKDATVVMLSHSLGSSGLMWDPQLEMLEQHYRVLNYDTRGHGGSDAPPGDYTLSQLAADALALLDALDIEQVHWVGLSMGGMIGQAMALDHAARLKSVALCDTMARLEPAMQPVWQSRIEQAREQGPQHLLVAVAPEAALPVGRGRARQGPQGIREEGQLGRPTTARGRSQQPIERAG